jgi:alpha-glucosidase
VLSNHDVVRHVTRYGGGSVGLARGRAAALMQLSLPGAAYLYNGDELGLENVDLPDSVRQDPIFRRTGGREVGRDGERVPLPWSGSTSPFGFSTAPVPWLPMPADWSALTIAAQSDDAGSTLNFYRQALSLRATLASEEFSWREAPPQCLSYGRGPVVVLLNGGTAPVPVPAGEVLLASGPLLDGQLPPDTAVWVRGTDND